MVNNSILDLDTLRRFVDLPKEYLQATPGAFWEDTQLAYAAHTLFMEAQAAGLIELVGGFGELQLYYWAPGPGKRPEALRADLNSDTYAEPSPITKGQLAYFCKLASKCLHLNKGAHTNWRPFEDMFVFEPGTMRRYLHNLEEKYGQLEDPYIDAFFENVKPYK